MGAQGILPLKRKMVTREKEFFTRNTSQRNSPPELENTIYSLNRQSWTWSICIRKHSTNWMLVWMKELNWMKDKKCTCFSHYLPEGLYGSKRESCIPKELAYWEQNWGKWIFLFIILLDYFFEDDWWISTVVFKVGVGTGGVAMLQRGSQCHLGVPPNGFPKTPKSPVCITLEEWLQPQGCAPLWVPTSPKTKSLFPRCRNTCKAASSGWERSSALAEERDWDKGISGSLILWWGGSLGVSLPLPCKCSCSRGVSFLFGPAGRFKPPSPQLPLLLSSCSPAAWDQPCTYPHSQDVR